MTKKCILEGYTGYKTCIVESMGPWAMQTCCDGFAAEMPILQLMAEITNHTKTSDIYRLVGADSYSNEDPRVLALINALARRDIPIRYNDDGYPED
jgi:hypothetical protein